jgi:lysophospholipase L1-like esterase
MKYYSIAYIALLISLAGCTSAQHKSIQYLALGDSYTIGEAVNVEERWPMQLANRLETADLDIQTTFIATSGWRTDDLIRGIESASPKSDYDMVSLLIGANNQFQKRDFSQYDKEFDQLLAKAIELAKGDTAAVFVLSIPDYYYTPFGQARGTALVSEELNAYNSYAEAKCLEWGVPFVNITPISEQGIIHPELVAKDGLHPSGQQYSLWVDQILKEVELAK